MKVTKNEKETKIVEVSYTITLTEAEAKRLAFVCDIIDWDASGETGMLCEQLVWELPAARNTLHLRDGAQLASIRIDEEAE